MADSEISRRRFAVIAGTAGAAAVGLRAAEPLTAESVAGRIHTELGGEWPANGPDGFKCGDPATPVKGIATTAMATVDVLRRAHQAGANLVLTYEPTFFGRPDGPLQAPQTGRGPVGISPGDPVYQAKRDFIEKNGIVVFRLRDHWQAKKQDDMVAGLAKSLGWSKYRVKSDDALYDIPPASARKLVAAVREKLNLRGGLRAVGNPDARIRRVLLHPGVMTAQTMWQRYADADLVLAGEVREWENTFFAADLLSAGENHGLVTIGRIVSEDPGMGECAAWLKDVVKEVPSRWIRVSDPYWRAS